MSEDSSETTTLHWMTCENDHLFKGALLGGVSIDRFVAAMEEIRCPTCGSKRLFLGGGFSRSRDLAQRTVGLDAPLSERLVDWRENGDVGLSSAALVFALTGFMAMPNSRDSKAVPLDGQDFRRIVFVLDRFPEVCGRIHRMRDLSPTWARLVDRLDELKATFEEEAGPDLAAGNWTKTQEILDAINDRG